MLIKKISSLSSDNSAANIIVVQSLCHKQNRHHGSLWNGKTQYIILLSKHEANLTLTPVLLIYTKQSPYFSTSQFLLLTVICSLCDIKWRALNCTIKQHILISKFGAEFTEGLLLPSVPFINNYLSCILHHKFLWKLMKSPYCTE